MNFLTKYGEQVKECPGYFSAYDLQRINAQLAPNHTQQEITNQASFYAFAKDVYEFNIMVNHLLENNIPLCWNRSLDIGGMEGTVARLCAGTKLADIADCVDIHDYRPQISDHIFSKYLKIWKILRCLYSTRIKYNFESHFGYKIKKLGVNKFISKPTISNYFTDGFISSELNGKYDFVSALLCMPYFKLDEFFQKLSGVMEDGGIFYMLSDYWWGQCNSSALTGAMPWAVQRLERDDFLRYFNECHSAIDKSYLNGRLDYYHHGVDRPTLTTYIKVAERYGFSLVDTKRLYGNDVDNERVFFKFDDLQKNGYVNDALKDIKYFRKDISEFDLRTNFISCIFRKNG